MILNYSWVKALLRINAARQAWYMGICSIIQNSTSSSIYEYSLELPEFLRPLSYSHLLFSPRPPDFEAGLGEPGVSDPTLDNDGPRGLGEPYEALLVPFIPPPIAFCNNGLELGENGKPVVLAFGLPFPDHGEPE